MRMLPKEVDLSMFPDQHLVDRVHSPAVDYKEPLSVAAHAAHVHVDMADHDQACVPGSYRGHLPQPGALPPNANGKLSGEITEDEQIGGNKDEP